MTDKPTYEELEQRVRELEKLDSKRKQDREALEESEERYRSILETINDGVILQAASGEILTWNKGAEKIFGIPPKEVIGQKTDAKDWPTIHVDGSKYEGKDHPSMRTLKTGEPYSNEIMGLYQPSGELRWISINTNPIFRIDEDLPYAVAISFSDITSLKKSEIELIESRTLMKTVIDTSPSCIFVKDLQGIYLLANKAIAALYNSSPNEMIGKTDLELAKIGQLGKSQAEAFWQDDLEVIKTKTSKVIPAEPLTGDDGKTHWFHTYKVPIGFPNNADCMLGIATDITERKKAEEALNEERSFLSAVLDNIEEAVVTCDREGRLLRFNEAARRLHGLPEKPIPPDQWADYYDLYRMDGTTPLPTEEIPLFRALKGERVQNAEIVVAPKHGGARFMVCSGQALTSAAGEVGGAVVAMHDITERKKAEEEIRQRNLELAALNAIGAMVNQSLKLEIVLQSSLKKTMSVLSAEGGLIYLFDETSGTFSLVSHQGISPDMLRELTGFRRGEGFSGRVAETGKPMLIALGEDAGNASLTSIREAFRYYAGVPITSKNKVLGVMSLVTRQENVFKPQQLSLLGQIGNQIGVAVENAYLYEWARRDLTKLEEAEKALRQSDARYRDLFENVSDFIYFHDMEGNFIETNLAFKGVYGYEHKEMEPVNARDMMPKENVHQFDDYLERIKKYGTDEGYFRFIDRNSKPVIVEYKNSLVFDSERKPIGVRGSARDITDKLSAENEKRKLEAELRQAQKMEAIGTLAGGIAHDFNNILSIIVGNTELAMLDVPKWSPAQDNLRELREATLRARELVKQILMFARQKESTVSNIHLEPIAKEALKMLRASIPATVEIQEKIQEALPPVLADPSQIQQIIMNLCTNAGQVMEAEGGALTFTLDIADLEAPLHTIVEELPPGRYVLMQVKDTGPGIPPAILDRLFDPFFTTKGVGEGTGLGLAVVYGIVQDRKGGIIVESEEGLGATFTVYLPASEGDSVEVKPEQKTGLPRGTERILFVDDEPMIMQLGQRMLERQGYTVEIRASGTDVLECFRQDPHRFDLVVTDMTMPGMRGDRLAEEILAIRPDMPVILCTGYSRQISKEKAREIGIRALVMKPLTQHELANTVRRVLDEKDSLS